MRDKQDKATLDLPGFAHDGALPLPPADAKRAAVARPRRQALFQQQLELLEATDTSGLPVWRRDEHTDATGLPIWAAA